mgnify:FL=1
MSLKRVGILTGGGLLRPQCGDPGGHPVGDYQLRGRSHRH